MKNLGKFLFAFIILAIIFCNYREETVVEIKPINQEISTYDDTNLIK